jgi:hypothetical protein
MFMIANAVVTCVTPSVRWGVVIVDDAQVVE